MNNYFVTGGAGFIGSYLAKRLMRDGRVRCYDNLSSGRRENVPANAIFHKEDIRNYTQLHGFMFNSDIVFHLAANTNTRNGIINPTIDLEAGLIGTYNVLLAMKDLQLKKLVFTSSCGVYGDDAVEPLIETYEPLRPICPYAEYKMKSEWLIKWFAREYGIQAWIFRLGNVVGGIMQNGVIRDLVLKLKEDKTKLDIMGSAKPCRAFLSVEDCVDAMLFAQKNSNDQVNTFNIAGSNSTNVGQIVKMLLKETNLDIPVNYEEQDRGWEGSAIEVKLDVNKIRRLGWEAKISSDAAVKKAIKEML